ncbi:endolytic transglycosylase MltG [Dyadobacter chenwenxiniae]|uniref:Endolytic murein transglycosylase n=1 Tax=Dyadobacter chenwenxiniae TaxID=2906456 RepID=A0A9X1TDM8_9BACT|nr:endolytic transglycosylase MltG [Dyadobacter chenwenxiniae]MCF0053391.1 endolytic transglycosylase MltG [Dyadobacter chenwenxiniae]MCF0060879.1 endolytic transglycosylase MltG [Dyadobacter chenwenxiniae]UON80706.1 endolytic transglycosylase MltG [Dyadobacter chenwenxiniae]
MSRNFKVGLFVTIAILTTTFTFYFWQIFKTPNLQVDKQSSFALLIPEKATYKTVLDSLNKHDVINDHISFQFLAKLLNYPDKVKPGRYVIKPGSNNYEVVKKLAAGNQDAVKLTFNNIRLKEDLITRIGSRFEFGEENFRKALNDPAVCNKYGLDTLTIVSMFLPNTYEVYWTTGTEKFLDRMHSEYKKYWTDERVAKAKAIGLTPVQVSILASIVEEEQARKVDERAKVAGLYINRLNAQMPLQADPTIKFALQDFAIKRILNGQLLIKSPYNTYANVGLPPGPIRVADLNSLNAVLNYDKHDYVYMCAKADLSGYHAFATNYADHLNNARMYQAELNRLKIMK